MKVILDSSYADLNSGRAYGPGEAEVPDRLAKEWLKNGLAKPVQEQRRKMISLGRENAEKAVAE